MTTSLPELRQIVLLSNDLEGTLGQLRTHLGVPSGFRDVEGMRKVGFNHEVVGFDRTYVEVCEPHDPESPLARKTAAKGDSGFMVVVQVADGDQLRERAGELELKPIVDKLHHGNPLSQWHPRDFGTLAEFDEIRPATSWHFAPDVYDARSTSVVRDLSAVRISVSEPADFAQRWATVTGGTVNDDGTSVVLSGRTVHFVDQPEMRGLTTVELEAADRDRAGEVHRISGVDFVLV
ncbi:VOC family protein [Nocardioides sp. JQ2195]|uniref:VOC family protein n=1 Tax=Nocardioides sp. JQ2195 TaxID=2592334 RepID=UPI00143EA161|nr:VOC family protein [Nocardioides sp. JQ2195]QIX25532.1 VOC family protein [Nocardioides sp. JQ2195]